MKIDMNKILGILGFIAKIAAFLSLTMSIVVKTRTLLGIKTELKKTEDGDDEDKS